MRKLKIRRRQNIEDRRLWFQKKIYQPKEIQTHIYKL